MVNISDVLDGHVGLDLACVDRLHLNAYVPILQVGGQASASTAISASRSPHRR
jgi:hypothetical protein